MGRVRLLTLVPEVVHIQEAEVRPVLKALREAVVLEEGLLEVIMVKTEDC